MAAPAAALYGESCQGGGIPVPDCGAAMVVELTTDSVLYASHENDRMYPASTTKLMTSLLAIEYVESGLGRLDDVIIFSDAAVNGIPRDTMHISISVGEKLTVEQVLYAMLLPSANEACLGMAEYVSGSIEAFVARMNERAAELGMKNTHYVTANGLHDDEHYTTAADMVLLMKEFLKHDVLRQISSTSTYVIPATNKYGARTLVNTNKCIVESSEYYNPDVVCGKTGFTTPAGNTLVTYSEVDGQQVVVVLLKAAQGITFSSTNRILG
ncbi:MAG: D-alanyl-D-alanine carboxypeptidase, partial [Oscillospiraceae bacterium]|nr:D-alanyl-D-alanine carboxypeptidase [Oscillospiraceae bacterium]